jgi:hypothetical protein
VPCWPSARARTRCRQGRRCRARSGGAPRATPAHQSRAQSPPSASPRELPKQTTVNELRRRPGAPERQPRKNRHGPPSGVPMVNGVRTDMVNARLRALSAPAPRARKTRACPHKSRPVSSNWSMTAVLLKADIPRRHLDVRLGPRPDAAVILKPSTGVSERDTFSKPWYVERWNEGVIYVETVLEEVDGR